MKKLASYTFTAPSSWASYLINGDDSGITDEEQAWADEFVRHIGAGSPVDCEDAGFKWTCDAMGLCPMTRLGGDMSTYTFLRREP